MAKVISFSIQKGGVSKTTSAGITADLLAEKGHRVLILDMDAQGNATEMMTGKAGLEFRGKTILEGMKAGDLSDYVILIRENLGIVPADDLLATMGRWLYQERGHGLKQIELALKRALEPLKDQWDFILIDTPPHLGEATTNALAAADYVIIPFEPSRFCFTAVPRFLEFVDLIRESLNPDLKVAGILRNMTDIRRQDVRDFNMAIQKEFPELTFETIIARKATTGRVNLYGLEENPERADAVKPFRPFIKELEERTNGK